MTYGSELQKYDLCRSAQVRPKAVECSSGLFSAHDCSPFAPPVCSPHSALHGRRGHSSFVEASPVHRLARIVRWQSVVHSRQVLAPVGVTGTEQWPAATDVAIDRMEAPRLADACSRDSGEGAKPERAPAAWLLETAVNLLQQTHIGLGSLLPQVREL